MKRYWLPIVALTLLLIGCGANLSQKVIGTWRIDTNSFKGDAIPPDAKNSPMYSAMMSTFAKARLTFNADGTVTAENMGADMPKGKWLMEGHEIKSADPKDNDKTKLFLSDDASKIHMTVEQEGKKMEFDWIKA